MLINALLELNEEMRVIAVGDDDQNIYEFRGSEYLDKLIVEKQAFMHELGWGKATETIQEEKNVRLFQNRP